MYNSNCMKRDKDRLSSEIYMKNTYYKQFGINYYVIVEGTADVKFYERFVDTNVCKVASVGNKDQVIKFIKSHNEKMICCLGFIDSDFDNINKKEDIENIIRTDYHDVEMLILKSKPNMNKIYSELAENYLINNFSKKYEISFIQAILNISYEIGLLKYIMKKYNVDMKDLPYLEVISEDFKLDMDELIKRVKYSYQSPYEIKCELEKLRNKKYDLYQITCGHDVSSILSFAFISKSNNGWGYGENKYLDKEKIESYLRVIYDEKEFLKTNMYKKIQKWEENHSNIISHDLLEKSN